MYYMADTPTQLSFSIVREHMSHIVYLVHLFRALPTRIYPTELYRLDWAKGIPKLYVIIARPVHVA